MSAKRVFFGVLQKIMVICGIMMVPLFGGVAHSAGVVFKRFTILCSVLLMIFATPAHADDACKNLYSGPESYSVVYWGSSGADILTTLNSLPEGSYTLSFTSTLLKRNDPADQSVTGWFATYPGGLIGTKSNAWGTATVGDSKKTVTSFTITSENKNKFTTVYLYGCGYDGVGQTGLAKIDNIQIERGTTATAYQPYNPLCATCDGTVVVENGESRCIPSIKIATTAYNSARFSPVVNDLNTTIATIRDVVTNTINQTAAIADLQATKQTRPDAECPKFRQCLLVEDNNNIPHWYLIKDPVRDLVTSLRDNKINSAGETTTAAFAANGYDGTNGTVNSSYYKGYVAMRKLADGSSSVNNRQFGAALTGGDNGGQYKTLNDQEWAVTWDGNETGTAGSFLPGVIYGTSRCSKVKPSSTAVGTDGWTTIENSEPTNDAANIASYVYCYCKMTGVGVDGEITPVRDSSRAPWVSSDKDVSAADCARVCAAHCANAVRIYAWFRSAVLDWAVE